MPNLRRMQIVLKTITIRDNDDPPVFSIENVSVTEGVNSAGLFVITQTPASGKNCIC